MGLQIKVNSFDGMKKDGYAELRVINDSKFKEQNIMFRSFYNKETGETWGIPVKVYGNGDVEWKKINLRGSVIKYNCKNPSEAMEYHVVSNSPFVEGSPTANIDVRYRIFDSEKEANNYVDETDKMIDACGFIKDLNLNDLVAYGPLFGISPETNSPALIRKALLEIAKREPKSILARKDKGSETQIVITLERAKRTGLVKTYPDRGLVYNEAITLGMNVNRSVEFLRDNPTILVDMDRESKNKDALYSPIKKTEATKVEAKKEEEFS